MPELFGVYIFFLKSRPILAGSHAFLLFKQPHEIFFIGKAAGVGNGSYGEKIALAQQIFGCGQPYMIYISIYRISRVFFHERSKIGRMIVIPGGQLFYRHRLVIVGTDPLDHVRKLSGGLVFQGPV